MSDVNAFTNETAAKFDGNFERYSDVTSLQPAVSVKVTGVVSRRPREKQASLTASLRKLALETPPSQRQEKVMVGSPTGMTVREEKKGDENSNREREQQQVAGRKEKKREEEIEEREKKKERKREESEASKDLFFGGHRAQSRKGSVLHRIVIVVREPGAGR